MNENYTSLNEVDDEFDLSLDADFFESLDESSWQLLETGSQPIPKTSINTTTHGQAPETVFSTSVGFQKANGKQLARPSASAMALAAKRLKLDEEDTFPAYDIENDGKRALHQRNHDRIAIPTMIPQHGLFLPRPSTAHPTPPCTPARSKRPHSSPLLPNLAKTDIKGTPSPLRKQISLGLTPRTYRSALPIKARSSFTPPFKKGVTLPVRSSQAPTICPSVAPCVFDLSVPNARFGYREAGLFPHAFMCEAEAREHGVPAEVCLILQDPTRALHYAFNTSSGIPGGAAEAYTELLELGASKAQMKWVQNHWQLILWKLAAYVASSPCQIQTYWTWNRVMRDLRYRYEREFQKKERSVIKQLQEEPSLYTKPMVLCVHQILRFDDTSEEGASLVLQLTDGWYKVRAELDAPLRRAVERRKIRVGHKLAIACAKHRCFGEGTHVLDAVYTSDLLLSSNATWFAAWDTKLGAQPHTFISSLGRLVPDGGLVGRIDVVAERVYPVGYMEGELDSKGTLVFRGSQYSAEEEQERQRAWEVQCRSARAHLSTIAPRLDRAAAWLEARCPMEYEGVVTTDVSSVVSVLEKAEDPCEWLATHASAAAHASLPYLGAILCAVRERALAVSQPGTPLYETALQELCAPRQVKSFCMVRVREARATRRASPRTVLLTVWNPPELVAGARYEITHLVPTQGQAWRPRHTDTDAFLSTTRESVVRRIAQSSATPE